MNLTKALPVVYFISGLGIAYNLDSALGFFSGSLLMLFACLTWLKRLEHQQPIKRLSRPAFSRHPRTS